MNQHLESIKNMGYQVDVAFKGYYDEGYEHSDGSKAESQSSPTVYRISGYGLDVMYPEDHPDIVQLADPDAHQFRIDYQRHIDSNDSYEMSPEDLEKRQIEIINKLGLAEV